MSGGAGGWAPAPSCPTTALPLRCPRGGGGSGGFSAPAFSSTSQSPFRPPAKERREGRGLLEAEERLVGAEGPHQRCYSRVTDGVALQAADRGQGALGVAASGPRGSPAGVMALRPAGGWGPCATPVPSPFLIPLPCPSVQPLPAEGRWVQHHQCQSLGIASIWAAPHGFQGDVCLQPPEKAA